MARWSRDSWRREEESTTEEDKEEEVTTEHTDYTEQTEEDRRNDEDQGAGFQLFPALPSVSCSVSSVCSVVPLFHFLPSGAGWLASGAAGGNACPEGKAKTPEV